MAPSEEEEKKPFTVQDRRRFSAEGEAKPEAPEEKSFTEQPRPQERVLKSGPSSGPAQDAPGGPSSGQRERASADYENASRAQSEITFASFMLGLSTEALALLGEMPHPATGEKIQDLVGAQQIIDVIALLKEKTRGNLSHDEDNLIDAILFDLRMKYVEKARQASR